jgi:hypothetical protein
MPDPAPDFLAILEELAARSVDFIVIGGIGAALQGAPVTTFDLDLVHSREAENVKRLLQALRALEAFYREQPARRLTPSAADLAAPGRHLLMTRAGPLDLLGAVVGGRSYAELIERAFPIQFAPGKSIRVLGLSTLIRLKEELGREKDLAMLPVLRRTLQEQERMKVGEGRVDG